MTENKYVYGTPDRPYSLFEGLAGVVCAWLDACVVIRARLANMTDSGSGSRSGGQDYQESVHAEKKGGYTGFFGIPGLGGLGPHGVF